MFNDEEDYGFLTGGLGDLDGDGDVDFTEYMNEEDDYQRIMGNKDNDDDFSISDDDDDWEFSYIDTAAEYGLNPYDYADKEEFFEALALAKSENDDLEDEYNNEEYCDYDDDTDENVDEYEDSEDENENGEIYLPDGFDISKLSLTIGATTSLNYDGKPIEQVFGVSEENDNNSAPKRTPAKQQEAQSIERKYYDRDNRKYRIGDAIYDNFKEVSDNYEKHECEDFSLLIEKIYRVYKELGVAIWVWAIHNFRDRRKFCVKAE